MPAPSSRASRKKNERGGKSYSEREKRSRGKHISDGSRRTREGSARSQRQTPIDTRRCRRPRRERGGTPNLERKREREITAKGRRPPQQAGRTSAFLPENSRRGKRVQQTKHSATASPACFEKAYKKGALTWSTPPSFPETCLRMGGEPHHPSFAQSNRALLFRNIFFFF